MLRQSSSALCYSSSSAVLPLRTLTLTVMSLRRKHDSRWLRVPPTLTGCVSHSQQQTDHQGLCSCLRSGLATAALGNGLCLAVLVYSTAGISGGHLNPAVSAGFVFTGRCAVLCHLVVCICHSASNSQGDDLVDDAGLLEPGVTWLGSLTHRDSHLTLQAGHAEVCAVYRGSSARGVCWWCLVACLVRSLNPEPHARPMLESVTDRQYEDRSVEERRASLSYHCLQTAFPPHTSRHLSPPPAN